jgi:uncharacterized protein (UPF0212 family)
MDCRVVVEAAVPVYDVETADEAVRIGISKTGEMLNPDLNYVEINMGERACPHCHEELEPAFVAADESLVALELEMTVFNVERDEHAARIARKEIGQRLENIPLEVLEIEEIPDEADDETAETETDSEAGTDSGTGTDSETSESTSDADQAVDGDEAASGDDEDVLPEFEELIDE